MTSTHDCDYPGHTSRIIIYALSWLSNASPRLIALGKGHDDFKLAHGEKTD
jgi:hypothetical protein